ncbi:DNA-binding response regulator [Clavibacter michiganensis]|nr:DNA-binding response regulator [Clavibacter michiganensis]
MIGVVLVDDQELVRYGLRMTIDATDDMHVLGEAASGEEAIELVRRAMPEVAVMDVRMPGMDGIEATRRITLEMPGTRVLVLTTFDLDEHAFGALRAGAAGFLIKSSPRAELLGAIRSIAAGDAVVSPRATRALLTAAAFALPRGDDPPRDGLGELTDREHDVFLAIAQGLNNDEIAARFFLSGSTVKTHVGRVLAKLGLRDRVQIVIFAYEHGLV